jgi:hypothetical protein
MRKPEVGETYRVEWNTKYSYFNTWQIVKVMNADDNRSVIGLILESERDEGGSAVNYTRGNIERFSLQSTMYKFTHYPLYNTPLYKAIHGTENPSKNKGQEE